MVAIQLALVVGAGVLFRKASLVLETYRFWRGPQLPSVQYWITCFSTKATIGREIGLHPSLVLVFELFSTGMCRLASCIGLYTIALVDVIHCSHILCIAST